MRNHLSVLIGSLRLIEVGGVTPPQQKQIEQCRAAIGRITGVLDNLEGGGVPDYIAQAGAELRALGAVTFLVKPFERSDLLRTVQLAARTHRNLRLLAADDVPEVGWLLEALLASSRCSLEVVRDGATAAARAREGSFDAILLDLDMPGMNGVETARAIREHEKADGRDRVPIVIVSGHDLEAAARPSGEGAAAAGDNNDDDGEVVTPDPEVAALVPEFLKKRRRDVVRLQQLIEASNWDALRDLGHKMKGTGRGYGFTGITEIGGRLEQAGAAKDAEAARSAVASLARYLDRVRIAGAGDAG